MARAPRSSRRRSRSGSRFPARLGYPLPHRPGARGTCGQLSSADAAATFDRPAVARPAASQQRRGGGGNRLRLHSASCPDESFADLRARTPKVQGRRQRLSAGGIVVGAASSARSAAGLTPPGPSAVRGLVRVQRGAGWAQVPLQAQGRRAARQRARPLRLAAVGADRPRRPARRGGSGRRAAVADGFLQQEPVEGQPPTERTEVRVAFDADNLYIGALLHDSDPDGDPRPSAAAGPRS